MRKIRITLILSLFLSFSSNAQPSLIDLLMIDKVENPLLVERFLYTKGFNFSGEDFDGEWLVRKYEGENIVIHYKTTLYEGEMLYLTVVFMNQSGKDFYDKQFEIWDWSLHQTIDTPDKKGFYNSMYVGKYDLAKIIYLGFKKERGESLYRLLF